MYVARRKTRRFIAVRKSPDESGEPSNDESQALRAQLARWRTAKSTV
jgi:hypothetical protein